MYADLDRRGVKLMLSNSDVPLIRELYAAYRVLQVHAARSVNCDATKRGKVPELVVLNYDPAELQPPAAANDDDDDSDGEEDNAELSADDDDLSPPDLD